ncbi:hypothetical protein STEG23_029938 [Scotinomys teguina]
MQPGQTTNSADRTMEVVAAAPRCQLLLIMLMAAMLLLGMKESPLLVQRTVTRTFELQENIGKGECDSSMLLGKGNASGILLGVATGVFWYNVFQVTTKIIHPTVEDSLRKYQHFEKKINVSVRVSITVKRHHDHSNSYKEKTFHWGWLTVSEVESIIIRAEHGGMQADMVLEKELRVLHPDP